MDVESLTALLQTSAGPHCLKELIPIKSSIESSIGASHEVLTMVSDNAHLSHFMVLLFVE